MTYIYIHVNCESIYKFQSFYIFWTWIVSYSHNCEASIDKKIYTRYNIASSIKKL